MESASRLESTNALIILAFEEKVDLGSCWSVAFEWCANQGLLGLRSRRQIIECFACQNWRLVDIWLYQFVGRLDRRSLEGKSSGQVGHCRS